MFSTSTQKKHWIFSTEDEIEDLRSKANEKFVSRYVNILEDEGQKEHFLSPTEERELCLLVEETAQKFCQSFNPPLLPSVIHTGFSFFKRFYLHNSVMEYLAKNVMMTCLYLACKVDEFTVSIDEFVRNLKSGTPASNTDTILSLEPQVMRQLRYNLTIHGPYRPMEGHFIEMKTLTEIPKVESLRPQCEEFLRRSLLTDVGFLYSPSQIALAAILHYGEKLGYDIYNHYILRVLADSDEATADTLVAKLQDCAKMVMSAETVSKEDAGRLQKRAQQCMSLLDQLNHRRGKRKHSESDAGKQSGDDSEGLPMKRMKNETSGDDSIDQESDANDDDDDDSDD